MYHGRNNNNSHSVTALKEILKRIKLDDDLVKENNDILHYFLRSLIDTMKRVDDLFNSLYREIFYTGSFYSDLRISKPDEFDINLVLNLPFSSSDFEVCRCSGVSSYVQYRLKNYRIALLNHSSLVRTLFEDDYLMPQKVRSWLQSTIAKALSIMSTLPHSLLVTLRQAGPAQTISIKKINGQTIDIDLVPVFSCTLGLSVHELDPDILARYGSSFKAFLVPKPISRTQTSVFRTIGSAESTRLWRTHFPEPEESIIFNMGCAKSIIKLLKLMRDKENWDILSSYSLKTVVMWLIICSDQFPDFWKEDNMGEVFSMAVDNLSKFVSTKQIPHILNKSNNLIEKINQAQGDNIFNRLKYYQRIISTDPNHLLTIWRL